MSLALEKIEDINKILIQDVPALNNIGLLNGKMGISIYFFHLARKTGSKEHQEFAEALIDDVFDEVGKNQLILDFENGLAGIAWGIEHLTKNKFVEADTDLVLTDVDNKIYRHIVASEKLPIGILRGAMGYILYVLSRLKGKDINANQPSIFVFRRLLIELVNHLGTVIEEGKMKIQESKLFDIFWDLPLCLVFLGKIRQANIYNSKIDQLLEHLSPIILSIYPQLLSNRLYLLFGIESILQQVDIRLWKNHAALLRRDISLDEILHKELKNKSLNLRHGITGIDFISHQLFRLTREEKFLFKRNELKEKIIFSEYWDYKEPEHFKKNVGVLYGLSGIALELLGLSIQNKSVIVKDV